MQTLAPREPARIILSQDEIPTSWYNIQADLNDPLPPPLDPATKLPVNPQSLERIFAKELIRQEISSEQNITIPETVRDAYVQIGRPTPLVRAMRLERFLRTPAKIFYKAEYLSPTGSHQQKPGRRTMMETYGAEVLPSPSNETKFGKSLLDQNQDHPGTLGIAISEALEDTVTHEDTRYCLGSVLNHVLLHQSIIGLEAKKQFESMDIEPDIIAGCIGGGSNFAGFAYPFIADKLKGKSDSEFVACEPKAVPSTTRGTYTYDFADTAEMTPLLKMYTVGHKYVSPPIHSGGLRYHGKAPSLCYLINKGLVKSVAYHQTEVFQAARTFARTEGVIPAPETAHCIKYVIDEAIRCKESNEEKVIAFNNCGHGLLDLKAYEDFQAGRLVDYEPASIQVESYVG